MKTTEQYTKNFSRAIRELTNAADFDGAYGVSHALRYIQEALKEVLFIKMELESNTKNQGEE